jgi:hypothetical protein
MAGQVNGVGVNLTGKYFSAAAKTLVIKAMI